MEQFETLFEVGASSWKIELRFKVGGGPFDPAGYSVQVLRPDGTVRAMVVHKEESESRPMAHLERLMHVASQVLLDALHAETTAEIAAWKAHHEGPTQSWANPPR
jgi:hypothetical protein